MGTSGPGRPSKYSDALVEHILDQLMQGRSLFRICEDKGMPHRVTVIRWLADHADFATRYARARETQADYMDDLILETANNSTPETANADRVKILAYQWRAAKLQPKKYGDKQQVEASVNVTQGGIDAPPRPATIEDAEQWLIRRRKELAELDGPPAEQPQSAPRHEAPVRPSNYEPRFPSNESRPPNNEPPPSQHEPPHTPRWPSPRYPEKPQPTASWSEQQEADWQRQQERQERDPIGFRLPRLPR
jgi:hypothetical protein